jgi:hypothetical protein
MSAFSGRDCRATTSIVTQQQLRHSHVERFDFRQVGQPQ